MLKKTPEWLRLFTLKYKAKVSHFFILWGNIYDLQEKFNGEYAESIYQYLVDLFSQRDMIMFYSLSSGLQFATEEMEKEFREKFIMSKMQSNDNGSGSATAQAAQNRQRNQAESAPLKMLVGDKPDQVFAFLEDVLADQESGNKVLIIDSAQNIAPNDITSHNLSDRINIEILDRWTRDDRFKQADSLVLLLTPTLAGMAEPLRSFQSSSVALRIPKPDETRRATRWDFNLSQNGVAVAEELTPEILGRLSNGLSLRQLDNIYLEAKQSGDIIDLDLLKHYKQEMLNNEYAGRMKVKIPQWGLDYFGGKENVKEYLMEVHDNILNGMYRRVPMGMTASGPPGVGKTFLFECWAHDCGFNFVEFTNPRNMYVGKSEEYMELMLSSLVDLAPVVVVEDEADQSETSRDVPNGDSGVSNRLRQMKFKFTSDPQNRGKVIWIRITNRDDLIDSAYKRKGRSDDIIPFVLPESEQEFVKIFKVMFNRYQIPTDIDDFVPFAKKVFAHNYCTGADVEWMVLEADKYAGRDGRDSVTGKDLDQSIDDWEFSMDPTEIDRQIMLAIQGSSKRLRPDNWQMILKEARERLGFNGKNKTAVFPNIKQDKEEVVKS